MKPLVLAVAAVGIACATPASAKQREITPYIEVDQVLSADLQGGDVLTYTTLAAGVDASWQTRRTQVQISYRYEHRFSESDRLSDSDVHSGLARAAVQVTPALSLEGGALATRARTDQRGDAPGLLVGNTSNVTQLYSLYAGPTLGTHLGAFGISGSYRYGYTKVDAPRFTGVDPSQPRLDYYDSSSNHLAQASINLKSGVYLPVGITLSGGWERDDASQLSQRYDGKYGRGDVILPVSATLALTAGAGYENIRITSRDALLDGNGFPVLDRHGRFVQDPNSPLRIAYDFDGIYYDGGFVWQPSPRTHVEAHLGERYGSTSFTGNLSYQPKKGVAIAVQVYDGVTTFGRQLRNGLAALPTSFVDNNQALSPDYNGCVFGSGSGGAGGCLNSVFQSISTAAFRARGVDGIASFEHGATRFGIGAGYANRKFLAPDASPGFTVNGLSDESYYIQGFVARALDSRTTVQGNVFANYYESGIAGSRGVWNVGGTASIGRQFGRLSAQAMVGLYGFSQEDVQTVIALDAAIGARYSF